MQSPGKRESVPPGTDKGVGVRVIIDPEVCQGHLRCLSVAPDMFDADEQGNGIVIRDVIDSPEDIERAESAVVGCPEGAIRLEQ